MTHAAPDFNKPEIITVHTDSISCDGGAGPLGHPRVYMMIDRHTHQADCPYCDRQFVLAGNAHNHQH